MIFRSLKLKWWQHQWISYIAKKYSSLRNKSLNKEHQIFSTLCSCLAENVNDLLLLNESCLKTSLDESSPEKGVGILVVEKLDMTHQGEAQRANYILSIMKRNKASSLRELLLPLHSPLWKMYILFLISWVLSFLLVVDYY